MTEVRLIYVTAKDIEQARSLARQLIERQVVACANILPQMESIYRWKGQIETDQEVVIILKTEVSLVDAVIEAIVELHPYETPCALSLAVENGAEGYLRWLTDSLNLRNQPFKGP